MGRWADGYIEMDDGSVMMAFGGPYDTYTIPVPENPEDYETEFGTLMGRERFNHDMGYKDETETIPLIVISEEKHLTHIDDLKTTISSLCDAVETALVSSGLAPYMTLDEQKVLKEALEKAVRFNENFNL